MFNVLTKNSLYLVTALAVVVGLYTAVRWASLPVLHRMVGLFFIGIVAHVWEENHFPGGFSEMITQHLHFTAKSKDFGEAVTMALVPKVDTQIIRKSFSDMQKFPALVDAVLAPSSTLDVFVHGCVGAA